MTLGPLKTTFRASIPISYLYVALSRVRNLQSLTLSEPLTLADVKSPPQKLLDELARLYALQPPMLSDSD